MARPWWNKKKKKPLKTRIINHMSVILGYTAGTCVVVFAACLPLVADPAIRVLLARVDPIPVMCQITRADYIIGKDNCSGFVSCREGFTATVYRCHQLYVNVRYEPFVSSKHYSNMNDSSFMEESYSRVIPDSSLKQEASQVTIESLLPEDYSNANTGNVSAESVLEESYSSKHTESLSMNDTDPMILEGGHVTSNASDMSVKDKPQWDGKNIKLYVNVNGYGYPPNVNCTIFWKRFGHVGMQFPCYYSRAQRDLLVTHYDYADTVMQLTTSILGPIAVFAVCLGFLWFWHCRGNQKDKQN